MGNNLMIFERHNVEVFEWNGQVLFNPKHVAECLDLTESGLRNHLAKMNKNQAILLKNSDVLNKDFRRLNNAGEKFLTESGVYKLIFKSHKEEAERFQDWVTDEVLPTIRKTGGMVVEGREEDFVNNYFPSFSEEVKLGMVQDLLKKNKELKPKADYYDKVLMPTDEDNNFTKLLTVTEVAKDLGISAKRLNNLLHEKGIIFKKGKTWHLYSQHQDKIPEYADYHITEYSQTLKFTEKGRKWILEMLKNEIK
ncbi:MAG: phage antirepressor [Clostridium sp.]